MHTGRFVFSELISHLPHKEFQKCVTLYDGDCHQRRFSCWDQYLAMAFAQLTYRESLRDIEACLGSSRASCIIWAFAVRWRDPRWPMPTKCTTGASSPTSRSI